MKKHLVTLVPECCQPTTAADGAVRPPAYSGSITLRMPTYPERMVLEGRGPERPKDLEDGAAVKAYSLAMIGVWSAELRSFVEAVAIKREADGFVFTDIDDVLVDTDIGDTVIEIVRKLRGDFKVGNAPTT